MALRASKMPEVIMNSLKKITLALGLMIGTSCVLPLISAPQERKEKIRWMQSLKNGGIEHVAIGAVIAIPIILLGAIASAHGR